MPVYRRKDMTDVLTVAVFIEKQLETSAQCHGLSVDAPQPQVIIF